MHAASKKVIETDDNLFGHYSLQEVVLHARPDVVPVNDDMVVPVRPALLVPEARSVHQLVHHDTCITRLTVCHSETIR